MERSLFVFTSLKLRVERHPLRSPAFLRLWLGLSISYVGDQFTTIALLWFVLQLTGAGVVISLVLLCFQLPAMLTGPSIRTVLDRWQARLVMGIDNCMRALLIGAIPVLFYSDRILHAGAQGYGLLWTGFGVGALVGVLCTSVVATRVRPGITPPLIAILWGGFLCPLMILDRKSTRLNSSHRCIS